jgi:hypothetical protein
LYSSAQRFDLIAVFFKFGMVLIEQENAVWNSDNDNQGGISAVRMVIL